MSTQMRETWGLLRKLGTVHFFRDRKCIHPTSNGHSSCGRLYAERPEWDPAHPFTCPECLRLLEQERKEVLVGLSISS